MRALALVIAASLSLTGCGINTQTSPAPLSHSVVDDRGVRFAFLTLETLATLADQAMDAKIVVPGTPRAKNIATGLRHAMYWVNAASAAQKSGSVTSYNEAFQHANEAMALVKQALAK